MNPIRSIKNLSAFEKGLWAVSVFVVTVSFLLLKNHNWMTMIASLIGVTALIFVAKGDVIGQVLTIIFGIVYAVISYRFRYFGEMITYLGMTAPIAFLSTITWLKNPYSQNEVKVNTLKKTSWFLLLLLTGIVTFLFYFILKAFGTANLVFSTISIATSFSASSLTMLRSPYYALAYAGNDIVLIILWGMASREHLSYLPMVLCFTMFLINDLYGYRNWAIMQKRQQA